MASTLLLGGLTLFGVIAIAVCVPLDLALRVERAQSRSVVWGGSLRALHGLVRFAFRGDDEPATPKPRPADGKPVRWKRFRPLLRAELVQRVVRLLGCLLSRLRIHHGRVDGDVGLERPSDTGMLFAALFPVLSLLATRPELTIDVRPAFQQPVLCGVVDVAIRVRPVWLLWESLCALCDPLVLRTLWAVRR